MRPMPHLRKPFRETSLSSLTDLTEAVDKKPNDAVRFDLLAVWVPDAAARLGGTG